MSMLLFAVPSFEGIYHIVVYLLMLSILVVLHEYGHFLLARRNGVRVNDFAVGFGPTLVKWTSPRTGTNYRINVLPIGGYCAMQGEDGKTSEAEQQRQFRAERAADLAAGQLTAGSGVAVAERPPPIAYEPRSTVPGDVGSDNFQGKSTFARLAIVVAGPVANFIVTLALLFVATIAFGVPDEKPTTTIGSLQPGSYPARRAGLRPGDTITAIDGVPMRTGDELVARIHSSLGKTLAVTFVRDGHPTTVKVTPVGQVIDGKRVGLIGFAPMRNSRRVGPVEAISTTFVQFGDMISQTVGSVVALVVHPAASSGQLQGVIGLARVSAAAQDMGWAVYLRLAAMISLSLGVLNLIPFPALDGGRAAFIFAEMLRGKPVDPEKEALVHVGGFAALMALMLFVAYHDVANIISGKGVF